MSEPPESPPLEDLPPPMPDSPPSESGAGESTGAQVAARVDEHPELAVGAAFGGGFLLALILKRLAA